MMDPNDVEKMHRPRPAQDADERETLGGVLDFLRATVVKKVSGLTDQDAFSEPIPPSALTVAGDLLRERIDGVTGE